MSKINNQLKAKAMQEWIAGILPDDQIVRFLSLSQFTAIFGPQPNRLHEPRLIYLIIHIKQGVGHCCLDNHEVLLQEGTLLLVNPFSYLHLADIHFLLGSVIIFTEEFFSRNHLYETLLYKATYQPKRSTSFELKGVEPACSYIRSSVSMFGWEYRFEKDCETKERLLHELLSGIILYLHKLQLQKEGGSYDTGAAHEKSKVVEFIQLLNMHFKEEDSLDFYAERMHMSIKVLSEICKKGIGWSPKAIMQSKVITESKRLLIFDDKSLQEISLDLGFQEHSSFHKFFLQHTGIAPRDFRMQNKVKAPRL